MFSKNSDMNNQKDYCREEITAAGKDIFLITGIFLVPSRNELGSKEILARTAF